MAIDIMNETITDAEIGHLLSSEADGISLKYCKNAILRLLEIGQENWSGDKKHFEARLDYLKSYETSLEQKLARKSRKKQCGISGCRVEFV